MARYGGFLEKPYDFAVDFFKISPKELKSIDPQQRLLLEVTWEAFENAAIKPSRLAGTSTGVFVGIGTDDYSQLMVQPSAQAIGPHYAIGTSHSTAAGRLSHWFDFNGPCIALDTACSSALVALHLACRSLQQGECELAVVAAVSCLLTDIYFDNFIAAGMLAKDGYCKVFDERADGYVRSEGCGVFILKPLSAAQQANDTIWGVIKGTSINHDGHCSSLTVPNGQQQEAVIRQALLAAQVDFNAIQYIETHGTGTALGDPIEINAIANLCEQYKRTIPLYLGAVKANLGHLEPAAGMAGLLKVLLCFKHGIVPGQPHCEQLTEKIAWDKLPLKVLRDHIAWPSDAKLSLAGISAFGFSGTNAHAILAAYDPEAVKTTITNQHVTLPFLLTLSAKSIQELKACIKQYRDLINLAANENTIQDLCYTTNCHRELFHQRVVFIATTQIGFVRLLDNYLFSLNALSDQSIKNVVIESTQDLNEVHVFTKIDYEPLKHVLPSFEALSEGEVDWLRFYQNKPFKKVSLPPYPFQRETIAFDQLNQRLAKAANKTSSEMLYDVVWEPIILNETLEPQDFSWIIFDQNGIFPELEFTQSFFTQRVTTLLDLKMQLENWSIPKAFQDAARRKRSRAAECTNEYMSSETSLQQSRILKGEGYIQLPIAVLFHYYALPEQANDVTVALNLLQQLLACLRICSNVKAPIKFWLLIKSIPSYHCAMNVLAGAFTALRLELPNLLQGQIEYQQSIPLQKNILAALQHSVTELSLKIMQDTFIVPRIVNRPNLFLENNHCSLTLNPKGVYVITGGTGGIAQILLNWLIKRGVASIALLSRTQPDHALDIFISTNKTCQIKHFIADVTVEADLFRTLEQVRQEMGDITGVMHTAGVNHYQTYTDLDEVSIEQIFLPKVKGAFLLDQYFKDKPLDFILHFSSVTAIWGTAKMTPYAAANHCLAALVNQSNRHLIVHWGPWDSVGMAARVFADKRLFTGLAAIPTTTALNYLEYALQTRSPLIIANIDWLVFLHLYQLQRSIRFFDKLPIAHTYHEKEISRSDQLQAKDLNASVLREIVSRILACPVEKIKLDTPLQEMGIDSIFALELVNQLQAYTSTPLPKTLIFDYPTLEKILLFIQSSTTPDSQKKSTKAAVAYEPIAIVGVACRVGDCQDVNAFWQKLTRGESFIQSDITETFCQRHGQLLPDGVSHAGNLLQNVYDFDPETFRLSPHEAKLMDPQQRIMLELAWQTIESAGYSVKEMAEQNGGVFIGVSNNEYAALCRKYMENSDGLFYVTSQANNVIAGRISYFFGLTGPSLVIDTACSSSLMAIHQACQSLQLGESEFALAGGINLIFSIEGMQSLTQANMLSKSGYCSPFDERADGYVRAEAAGMVMLKTLAAAEADGDTILAVICGSAANQDGKSASLTAPSSTAQIAVMEKALSLSTYQASEIDFVEAHGTGTPLGDPIELQAIEKVYTKNRAAGSSIYIGSIKSQIGHAESAAGVLSLISVLGRLQTRQLFKQYRYSNLNKHVRLQTNAVIIPTTMIDLRYKKQCLASINAFGFSGTNVNLVVTNYFNTATLQATADFQFPCATYSFKGAAYSVVPEHLRYLYQQRINENLYAIDWISKTSDLSQSETYFTQTLLQHAIKIQQAKQLNYDADQAAYDQSLVVLNNFCLQSFIAALRLLGLNAAQGIDNRTIESLPIAQSHHRYVNLLLQHISSFPEKYTEAIDLSLEREKTPIVHEYQVAKRVAQHLISLLTGQQSALDVLFPQGDATLVNAIYQKSPKSRLLNQILAEILQDCLKMIHLKDRPLKILEVGAGTGGTTASILPMLSDIHYHYTYTDNSPTLLAFAQQRFAAYSNITYTVFDLENMQQLSHQFYQQFDVVIAANVIHATKNINQTVALLNQCLKLSGLLFVFEGTQPVPWIDFIFGLTPGWWRFADERQDYPLLSQAQWQQKFKENEFSVEIVAPDRISGQCLILGQKLGLTKQLSQPVIILLATSQIKIDEWVKSNKFYGIKLIPLIVESDDLDDHVRSNFSQLFANLNDQYSPILGIVYLWNEQKLQEIGDVFNLYTFLQMIRAKQRSALSTQPLVILTESSVYPKRLSQQPVGAALWGMAQVIKLEYPDLKVVTIDIDCWDPNYLFNEISHGLSASQVAYSNQIRYEAYLSRLTPRNNKKHGDADFVIKNTAWIIAGGCGGLGQEVARWLAQQGASHVMLLGRHGLNEKSKKNIDCIQRDYSTQFTVYHVDISDRLDMQKLIEELRQQAVSYKGILQLAGVVSDALIETMTFEQYQTVFNAKVFGTQNLMLLARQLSLSYFIAFSSATAVIGNIGQVNHAAVNAYLDSFILAHKNDFTRVLTIDWGPWSETGAVSSILVNQIAAKGVRAFNNQEGLRCMLQAMEADKDQVITISIDWKTFSQNRFYQSFYQQVWPKLLENTEVSGEESTPKAEEYIAANQFDVDTIKQQLKALFSKKLQCSLTKLSDTTGFYALGVDSLMAIALTHELEQLYKTKFDSVLLFNYPTFNDLSHYINQYLLEKNQELTKQSSIRHALKDLIEVTKEELL